jgi:hypothetical protein
MRQASLCGMLRGVSSKEHMQREGEGAVVVRQRHLIAVVVTFLIGCVVLLLGVGCAGVRSESAKEQGHTEAAKKEQTRSPEATAADETTALGETTAFQAPEGTKATSTARIACLRADQRASSPPPQSTQALNGNSLARVLTPKVAAHPDGVHIQFDNRLGKGAVYVANNGAFGASIPEGKSNQEALLPPGTAKINCYLSGDVGINYASFEVVEGDSGYKSLELECKPGAVPQSGGIVASGADSKFELVSYRDPVEEAREHYKKGLKEGDVVEEAGYPTDPDPTVRVIRNGKVIATYWSDPSGSWSVTYCDGQI